MKDIGKQNKIRKIITVYEWRDHIRKCKEDTTNGKTNGNAKGVTTGRKLMMKMS